MKEHSSHAPQSNDTHIGTREIEWKPSRDISIFDWPCATFLHWSITTVRWRRTEENVFDSNDSLYLFYFILCGCCCRRRRGCCSSWHVRLAVFVPLFSWMSWSIQYACMWRIYIFAAVTDLFYYFFFSVGVDSFDFVVAPCIVHQNLNINTYTHVTKHFELLVCQKRQQKKWTELQLRVLHAYKMPHQCDGTQSSRHSSFMEYVFGQQRTNKQTKWIRNRLEATNDLP